MAKEKPTLFRLTKKLEAARRFYAAGKPHTANKHMQEFKEQAEEVLAEQKEAMVKDMNHHLKLRGQLRDLTTEAKLFAAEVKSETSK